MLNLEIKERISFNECFLDVDNYAFGMNQARKVCGKGGKISKLISRSIGIRLA